VYSRVGDHGRPHGRARAPGQNQERCCHRVKAPVAPSPVPPFFRPPAHRAVRGGSQRSDRTREERKRHTRGREASLSLLPSQSRISPPPLTSRRGPGEHEWNRAAATTSGGGRVSGEEKRRSVASHHRSRRVRGITRVSSAAVAAANATLACQCVTGGGGGRDGNKRWMRACNPSVTCEAVEGAMMLLLLMDIQL
jgi:hypothetical protein